MRSPSAVGSSSSAAVEIPQALFVTTLTGCVVRFHVLPSDSPTQIRQQLSGCSETCFITQYSLRNDETGQTLAETKTLKEQGLGGRPVLKMSMATSPYDLRGLRDHVTRLREMTMEPIGSLSLARADAAWGGASGGDFPSLHADAEWVAKAFATPAEETPPHLTDGCAAHSEELSQFLPEPPLPRTAFPLVTMSVMDPTPERRLRGDQLCLDAIWGKQMVRIVATGAGFHTVAGSSRMTAAADSEPTSRSYGTLLGLLCDQLPGTWRRWVDICSSRAATEPSVLEPPPPPTAPPLWLSPPPAEKAMDFWNTNETEFVSCQPADPRAPPRDWTQELWDLRDRGASCAAVQRFWTEFCSAAAATAQRAVDGATFACNPSEPFHCRIFMQTNLVVTFCTETERTGGPLDVDWFSARREAAMAEAVRAAGCAGVSLPLFCVVEYKGWRAVCRALTHESTVQLVFGGPSAPLVAGWAERRPGAAPAGECCVVEPEAEEMVESLRESFLVGQLMPAQRLPSGVRLLRTACGRVLLHGAHRLLPHDESGRPHRIELVHSYVARLDEEVGRAPDCADRSRTSNGTNEHGSPDCSSEQGPSSSSPVSRASAGTVSSVSSPRECPSPAGPGSPRLSRVRLALDVCLDQAVRRLGCAVAEGRADPCDGEALTVLLHGVGVPMRRVGRLVDLLPAAHRVRRVAQQEVAARCLKRALREVLREHRTKACAGPVARLLNDALGSTAGTAAKLRIQADAAERHGVLLPEQWWQGHPPEGPWPILRRALQATGLQIVLRDYDFGRPAPFRTGGFDIAGAEPRCYAAPPAPPTVSPHSTDAFLELICALETASGAAAEQLPERLLRLAETLRSSQGPSAAVEALRCSVTQAGRLWGRDSTRVIPFLLAHGRAALLSAGSAAAAMRSFHRAFVIAKYAGGHDSQEAHAARVGYAAAAVAAGMGGAAVPAAEAAHAYHARMMADEDDDSSSDGGYPSTVADELYHTTAERYCGSLLAAARATA